MRHWLAIGVVAALGYYHSISSAAVSFQAPNRSFALEVMLTDGAGARIPNATVVLHGPFGAERRRFAQDGLCAFAGLQIGDYRIVASAPGFLPISYADHFIVDEALRLVLQPLPVNQQKLSGSAVSVVDLRAPRKAREEYKKGLGYQDEGRQAEARRAFLAAIASYPQYSAAYSSLGITLLQLKEREEALKVLERALELNPLSYDAQLTTGLILNDQRRFVEAQEYLSAATRLNTGDWRLHYEQGRMHYGLGRYSEAERSLRMARRSQPPYGNLYLLLGNTLVLQEKYEEAISELEEFLRVAPQHRAAEQVREKLLLLRNR